jgi:carbon storage regulator
VLVFTRRRGEAIIIGGGIEVRVLRVGRDGVRLGVVAPESVPVHRQEVHAQISEANRAAADPAAADPAHRAAVEAALKARLP